MKQEPKFRIVEFRNKFYIEKLVSSCIPLIRKRKEWVRLNELGDFGITYWNYRGPQRPELNDMEFNSLQHARNWLRTPKIKSEPIYHEP